MAPTPGEADAATPPLLEMRNISKAFPGVVANDHVDLSVAAGEIHALLGENGAGKSTLMKILFGLQQPDRGEILLSGRRVKLRSPAEAIAAGIGMIHQHFMLVPTLTVAENIALGGTLDGSRGSPLGRLRLEEVSEAVRGLSATYDVAVDPEAEIWQLSVGERQRVEILKALFRGSRLLVLDEPTAVLTPPEVDQLFGTLRRIAADGCGLVFISHKLHEVLALADRITVLRDGAVTGSVVPAETSRQELADLMVGRPVRLAPDKPASHVGPPRLEVRALCATGDRQNDAVVDVSFDVRAGEVVGIAGVSGNGQRELAEAIAGLRPVDAGEVLVNGVAVAGETPRRIRDAGLAYVPEERMRDGAIGTFTVWENLLLLDHDRTPYARRGLLRMRPIRGHARALTSDFAVRTPSIDTPIGSLSGGNIQKVIMAREMTSLPAGGVLVAAQPTRGVDIGAAEYLHDRLMRARADGVAVLVISEDLDEVLALSDRVVVMFEGRVVANLDRADCTLDRLGLLMTSGADRA